MESLAIETYCGKLGTVLLLTRGVDFEAKKRLRRMLRRRKIEFAINNLMMTIKIQGRMNNIINSQVSVISRNKINAN